MFLFLVRRRSEPSFCAQLLSAWREAGKFNRRQILIEAILSDLPFYRTLASGVRLDKKAAAQPTCVEYVPHYSLARTHKRREKPKCRQQKKSFATSLDCSFHSFLKRDAVCVEAMEHAECDFLF